MFSAVLDGCRCEVVINDLVLEEMVPPGIREELLRFLEKLRECERYYNIITTITTILFFILLLLI